MILGGDLVSEERTETKLMINIVANISPTIQQKQYLNWKVKINFSSAARNPVRFNNQVKDELFWQTTNDF